MATDDAETSESGQLDGDESADSTTGGGRPASSSDAARADGPARVGDYTWADFMQEHGYEAEVSMLYPARADPSDGDVLTTDSLGRPEKPSGEEWESVDFDPATYLGFHPDDVERRLARAAVTRDNPLYDAYDVRADPNKSPIAVGRYTWEDFKAEYYYDDDGTPPERKGEVEPFDPAEYLGWHPDHTDGVFADAGNVGEHLAGLVEDRTVTTLDQFTEEDINAVPDVEEADVEAFDEDEFFTDEWGNRTVVDRYDLEKAVPESKKTHFREIERYWVNKPYAFIIIFHSIKENEKKYYAIEPYQNEIESDLQEYITGKLRTAIKYSDDDVVVEGSQEDRAEVIERETRQLLDRYGIYDGPVDPAKVKAERQESDGGGFLSKIGLGGLFSGSEEEDEEDDDTPPELEGLSRRPEPALLEEDATTLTEYQVEKLLYYLKRNFIGYERIDPIKHDTVHVEDLGVDGYHQPVFVNHGSYEWMITNVYHGEDELDDFVVKLAQRSGKGISKRNPQVDATLPDGSRSQLTLGEEVSDHGTNYTIRQFKDVPLTPIDEINWNTLSLDETAYLWLCIENNKSMIIAGGTATGKTTLLNAMSLFIPSNSKIVTIEDTREVELPQRNWLASVTRPSFGEDDKGDVDEFDLLEAALRQRPDYIVMGEVRGEEGRTLFQVMSTGHTSYSTFHADSVGEVLKRFTTDPINVSKTMFTALDLVAIQNRTRVDGNSVVRNVSLTEINHYDAENDEINVQDVYQWQAETDEFLKMGESNTLEEIMFDRGWNHDKLQEELFYREVILAYLIHNGLNTYTQVAATIQAFINDPDTLLTLIANDQLEKSLEDLREMESVNIDVDPEKEKMAPRPDPTEEIKQLCLDILDRAEDSLFEEYRNKEALGLASAIEDDEPDADELLELPDVDEEEDEIEFSGELREDAFQTDDIGMGTDDDEPFAFGEDAESDASAPAEPATAEASPEATAATDANAGETTAPETSDDSPDWLFGGEDDRVILGEGNDDEPAEEEEAEISFGFDDGDERDEASEDAPEAGAMAFGDTGPEPDDSTDGEDDGSGMAFGDPEPEPDDSTDDEDDGGAMAFGDPEPDDAEGGSGMAFGDPEPEPDDDTDDTLVFGETESNDDEDDSGGMAFGDPESEPDDAEDGAGMAFGDPEPEPDDDDAGGLAFGSNGDGDDSETEDDDG